MKAKTIWGAGDWMKAWSGVIGKCHLSDDKKFITWKGSYHGRHGQTHKVANREYSIIDGVIYPHEQGSRLTHNDLIENMPYELAQELGIRSRIDDNELYNLYNAYYKSISETLRLTDEA